MKTLEFDTEKKTVSPPGGFNNPPSFLSSFAGLTIIMVVVRSRSQLSSPFPVFQPRYEGLLRGRWKIGGGGSSFSPGEY